MYLGANICVTQIVRLEGGNCVDGNLKVDHLSIIGQVITVEDWSEIQVLARREGLSHCTKNSKTLGINHVQTIFMIFVDLLH